MEPPNSPKIRLMCSYGGHIVPRPHDRNLFYAAGETRIIAVDRRSTAVASILALKSHLSRSVFNNRAFHLKYQLPNEDLDSLISVVTDEDLSNMIDEYDRISEQQGRIRLFLFPIKAESLNSGVLGDKSESWFCDASKNTRITRSADESGGVGKVVVVGAAESLVLETSSSFGSTGSSLCMSNSNSPPVGGGVGCEETAGLSFMDRMIRVPSSASIESEYSAGLAVPAPKTGTCQEEPLIKVDDPDVPSFLIEAETAAAYNPLISVPMQSAVQVLGYPVPQQPDGKQIQYETPLVQGGFQYVPQYPVSSVPMPSYYPYYQMPVQQQKIPCTSNQQYPIYFVPVRPAQYHNMPNAYNFIDTTYTSRPTLYPQTAVIPPSVQKELFGVQTISESATMVHRSIPANTPLINIPSNQGQLMTEFSEQQNLSEPVTPTSVASSTQSSEVDEDIVYNQIYKTQPLAPLLASHYQTVTKGVNVMLSESSVQLQPNHTKQQAAVHPL